MRTLEEAEHTIPTPIQEQAIPVVIDGYDVVGLAQTGTGKTAAFLLPLIHKQDRPNHKGKYRPIRVLILSPTRELAAQIAEKARQFGKSMNLRSQLTVGGVPITKQMQQMSRGADILIATPGRLLDLVKRDALQLDKVEALVLDEADHMLDIGFLPDVKRIIGYLPKERQTLLFSATMPKAIQDLAAQYLKEPVEISVARQSSVAENIDQSVKHINGGQKPDVLAELLRKHTDTKTVVFARTKHGADNIVRRLGGEDITARAIHGNKSQGQRERALKAFTRGDYNVLVATDIAARGIDIKDVGLVVNYELPDVPEVYVHRIGRTARAGATGKAVSFCTSTEVNQLRGIERLIKMSIPAEGKIEHPAGSSKSKGKPKPKRTSNRPGSKARKKPDFKNRGEAKQEHASSDRRSDTRPPKQSDKPSGKKPFRKSRDDDKGRSFKDRDVSHKSRDRDDRSERSDDNRSRGSDFDKSKKPRRDRPHSDKPRFDKESGTRSESADGQKRKSSFKPRGDRADNRDEKQRDRKPRRDREDGQQENRRDRKPRSDNRSRDDRSRNERSDTRDTRGGDKPFSKKSRNERSRDDKPRDKPQRDDKRRNDKPKSDRPRGERSENTKSDRGLNGGDRPRFKKPSGGKPRRQKPD